MSAPNPAFSWQQSAVTRTWMLASICGLIGFIAYFLMARFVPGIRWNAIELIIAQHLIDHGVYATSLDYPSALTWRPVLPTLCVTFVRLFTSDPLLIYQIVCGTAFGVLAATMFLAAQRLAGNFVGVLTAVLTLTCPALTTYLVFHPHSYSHVVTMLFFGPALFATVRLIVPRADTASPRAYALAGGLWSLAYLCRSELGLFALLAFITLAWHQWSTARRWQALLVFAGTFAPLFIGYNVSANHVAARDGILIRKAIYGFYMSQGWAEPPSTVAGDIEANGYVKAIEVYGDPVQNNESLFTAIRRNPSAFSRRVEGNAARFYQLYSNPVFMSRTWSIIALGAALVALIGTRGGARLVTLFLVGLFCGSHFVLIYHIDPRYMTINIPALLQLIALGLHVVLEWLAKRRSSVPVVLAQGAALAGTCWLGYPVLVHASQLSDDPSAKIAALRAVGAHFRSTAAHHGPLLNREPHIVLHFPDRSPIPPEEQFLIPYFSRTAWVNGGAEGVFPRGRFYSYRESPVDFEYLPQSKLSDPSTLAGRRLVAEAEFPILGRYVLLQKSAP